MLRAERLVNKLEFVDEAVQKWRGRSGRGVLPGACSFGAAARVESVLLEEEFIAFTG